MAVILAAFAVVAGFAAAGFAVHSLWWIAIVSGAFLVLGFVWRALVYLVTARRDIGLR